MQVQRLGLDEFSVEVAQETPRALYISQYMPQPLRPLPKWVQYDRPEAGAPGALMADVGLWPEDLDRREVVIVPEFPGMPDVSGGGLWPLWVEAAGSAVLVPLQTAGELSLRRNVGVALLLDPRSLAVPAVGAVLRRAAEVVLGVAQPEMLLRVGLHWAFACEVSQSPWAQNDQTLEHHALSVPQLIRGEVDGASHRLVVPQIVRLIATEAVCSRRYPDVAAAYDPAALSVLEQGLVEEFFPSVAAGRVPSHSELRTALWVLAHDSPFEELGSDGLSMLTAHTFGMRSTGTPQDSLRHWYELLSLPDDHPYGSWGAGQAPSDLRADLSTSLGVEMRFVAVAVCWMITVMVSSQDSGNQLFTLATLLDCVKRMLGHPDAAHPLTFAAEHLSTTVEHLRDSLDLECV